MKLFNNSAGLRAALGNDRAASIQSVIQIVAMLGWLALLIKTNAFYVIYLIVGLAGLFCRNVVKEDKSDIFDRAERSDVIISSVFSLAIIAANYDIYESVVRSISTHSGTASVFLLSHLTASSFGIFLLYFPVLFVGGLYHAFFILKFLSVKLVPFRFKYCRNEADSRKVFLSVLLLLCGVYSAILLLCFYPGIITPDSVNQLKEIRNNTYSNRNPFCHTMLIRLFVTIGQNVFGSLTFGVALYSLFSVFFLSLAFAYAAVTLYQLHVDKKVITAVVLMYLLMPYHVIYSFTVWKDIPFCSCVLLFVVSLLRYFCKVGKNHILNLCLLFIGGFGICLFRGNGLIVYLVFIIAFAVVFGQKQKRLLLSFAGVLAAALILTYPVLNALHIKQSDSVELLTVPIQQISRSIVDGNELTDSQRALLSHVVDVDAIPRKYNPLLSDPMKVLIRQTNNEKYFKTHKLEFLKLYLEIGVSHPGSYFTAWVDQTKGYWNAGYDNWRYSFARMGEDIGVGKYTVSSTLQKVFYAYAELFEYVEILQPFVCIGFFTWLLLLVLYIGCRKKDRLSVILTLPSLAVVFTMLLGSPVYSEFRYVYAVFCCLPFLSVLIFRPEKSDEKNANL